MRRTFRGFTLLSGMGLMTLTGACARADEAVVVGVNQYPQLSQGSNLEGCVNDADSVAAVLKDEYGFSQVTELTDGQATKAAILSKLAEVKGHIKAAERFVFYMASHGARSAEGESMLLPGDALEADSSHDITKDELYEAVNAIPAASKSVILDSCFSGGLARKALGVRIIHTRFHQRQQSRPKHIIDEVNNQDNNKDVTNGQDVCYFVASQAHQTSGEDTFGQKADGVFTHFLVERLKDVAHNRWGDIQKDVTGAVADYMDQTQTPLLGPAAFENVVVFGNANGPAPRPTPGRTVWDDYNEDYNDSTQLELLMTPNLKSVKVKQQFSFDAQIGSDGYLVILDKDPDGNVYLLYPRKGTVEDAQVKAGTLRLPPDIGHSYSADTPGSEKAKAILFSNRENAKSLLAAFPKDGSGLPIRKLRKINDDPTRRYPFYTSVLTFNVEAAP